MPFFDIAIALILIILLFQDFTSRKVSFLLLPLLFIIANIKSFWLLGSTSMLLASKNLVFLCIQFCALYFFYLIKNKKPTKIIDTYIGLGDILFLIAITPLLSLYNFVIYYSTSIFLSLAFSIIVFHRKQKKSPNEIPLAGYLSLALILWLLLSYINPTFNFYDDSSIIMLIISWK